MPSMVILTVGFVLMACRRQDKKPAASTEKKLNVVTTVAPLTSIVANIFGDKAQVAGTIPEGNSVEPCEPIPREVVRLIEQIRKEKVPAVFGSEVFPSPVLEQIAREAKSRYIDKLRDDELPGKPGDPQHSYIGMMVENMTIMFEALGGSTKALKKVDSAPVAGAHADYRRRS